MLKIGIFIIFITLFISTTLTYLFSESISLLNWVNTLFLCSLLLTLSGAILYIIQSGFFNNFIQHFRYFFKKINKAEQEANKVEGKYSNNAIRPIKVPSCYPMLLAGFFLVALSTVLSLLIA